MRAAFICDPLVASACATVPAGKPVPTTAPGAHSFTVTATVADGLRRATVPVTITYSVSR